MPVLFRSSPLSPARTGTTLHITRARAGWHYVDFAVHQIAPKRPWVATTHRSECCLVLLRGSCRVTFGDRVAELGPRADVFASYPHAVYLPPRTNVRVDAHEPTEIADGRAPARTRLPRA